MRIRLATAKDAKPLARISAGVFGESRMEDELAVIEHAMKNPVKQASFVAEDKGKIAAYLIVEKRHEFYGKTAFFTTLVVTKPYQGKGIGRMLCEKSLKQLKKLGFKNASLLVDPKNERAMSLYGKLGFKPYRWLVLKRM